MLNYYHILGISQKAGEQEIKAAYRRLALQYHPDKNPGSSYAEERFKEISLAYNVLSHPEKKAQHDLRLMYNELQAQVQAYSQPSASGSRPGQGPPHEPPRSYRQRPPQYRQYRPVPADMPNNHNIIATAWAFGIVFAIAVLVMGLSSYRTYQHEQLMREQTEVAMQTYQQAEKFFRQGNYAHALELLQAIDKQYKIPYNAGRLRREVLQKLEKEAGDLFEQGDFQAAARLYQLLAEHQAEYNAFTYARLVSSYEMIPDYSQAIHTYEKVIQAEPLTIEARNRLAAILYETGEYEQALRYYRQASDIVAREYQHLYGRAYALVVNPGKTPESHYSLHCGLGKTYTRLAKHQQAEKAFKWAIFLRPGKADAYYLQGLNFRESQQGTKACRAWKKASRLGSEEAAEALKKYCR